MSKNNAIIPLLAAGAAAYLFLTRNSGQPVTQSNLTLLPGTGTQAAAAYGINSGVRGGNGAFYTCANYDQLAQINPNLTNPNYIMNANENGQYLANYLDLRQGLPGWVGHKMANGITPGNLTQAAQAHWNMYGCAEKRIFMPLQPPSGANFIPAPPNPKSSGSGVLGSILKAVTIVAGGVITVASGGTAAPLVAAGESAALAAENMIHGVNQLNDAELSMLFNGAAIAKAILPFYNGNNPAAVQLIENKIDQVLKNYA